MLFLLDVNTCAFAGGGVNANNWIGINLLVVMLFFSIAGIIYAVSNLLPASTREKLKITAKFEIMQMMLSLFIIFILIGFASLSCNFTNSVSGMDTFAAAQLYIGKLLFVDGINLATHIYTTSIEFMIGSEIAKFANGLIGGLTIPISTSVLKISITSSPTLDQIYSTYSNVVVGYNAFVVLTFGMLFLQFIALFIVKGIMLTVVLPVAIAMRSLSFLGPKLREAANSFLALAIAFYFVYPLTFVMDSYIMNWTYCSNPAMTSCNPYYSSYPLAYTANSVPASSLFAANPNYNAFGFSVSMPANFYGSLLSSGIPLYEILYAPATIGIIAQEVSDFVFQGIFLMAIDMGITVAFAINLTKAFTAGFGLRSESIWS
ncbi:MAG: hypothetical protein ACP5RK_00405 [Candidatus Micrarchaeia archaeon]